MSALPSSKCARSFDPAPAFATLPPLPAALVRRGDLRLPIVHDANRQALTYVCGQEKGALECYEWSRPRR